MSTIAALLDSLSQVSPLQLAAALAVAALLSLATVDRRTAVLLCTAQWLILGISVLPVLYRSVVLVRLAVTLAIAIMLLVSTGRQQSPSSIRHSSGDLAPTDRLSAAFGATALGDMGLGFRLAAAAFGLLMAYGMWRAYPLTITPRGLDLALYETLALALLMMLTSVDLLRRGLGLLTLINGAQSLYLYLEQSLLVVAFWGVLSVVMALAIVYLADAARPTADREPEPL